METKVVKIVKTIGPDRNWERIRGYVDTKPMKMDAIHGLLAEDGWKKVEDVRVEHPWNWLPFKEITTIIMSRETAREGGEPPTAAR